LAETAQGGGARQGEEPQGCRQVPAATVALGFGLEGSPAERVVGLDLKLLTGRRIPQGDPRTVTSQQLRLNPPSGRPLIEESMSGPLDLGRDAFLRSGPHPKPKPHMRPSEAITNEKKAVDFLPIQEFPDDGTNDLEQDLVAVIVIIQMKGVPVGIAQEGVPRKGGRGKPASQANSEAGNQE